MPEIKVTELESAPPIMLNEHVSLHDTVAIALWFSFALIAELGLNVGAVASIVIDKADESFVAPLIVALATIDLEPSLKVPVVQLHAPVDELAVQALPLETPLTYS